MRSCVRLYISVWSEILVMKVIIQASASAADIWQSEYRYEQQLKSEPQIGWGCPAMWIARRAVFFQGETDETYSYWDRWSGLGGTKPPSSSDQKNGGCG